MCGKSLSTLTRPLQALQARLAEVEGRVKALEAELAGLRQEAQQLAERRGWAAQHHQQLCEKIKVRPAGAGCVGGASHSLLQL